MADFALDQVMDMEEDRLDYHMGLMDPQEAYDRGIIDELGYEGRGGNPLKSCKHCGQTGLAWKRIEGKWRLSSGSGEVHTCKEHKF